MPGRRSTLSRAVLTLASLPLLAGCGTLVTISSSYTPPPPSCFTPRPPTATDSFSTKVVTKPATGGLEIGDVRVGCGSRAAKAGDIVDLQFSAWLADGTFIATSRTGGQPPVTFTLGNPQVNPPFWNLGVPGMRAGGLRRLVVPPALAFGPQGSANAHVPPNTTIVLDIEMLSVTAQG